MAIMNKRESPKLITRFNFEFNPVGVIIMKILIR